MPVKQSKAKASLAHGQTPIKKKKHASPITKKIKKVQQYTNWVDSASTKVEDVTVHWITKFNSKEAAFINHHKKHFQEAGQESFPTLFAIMGRRDSNEAPLNRYLKAQPGTSFYWECLVAERNDNDTASTLGRRIAKEFTDFGATCNDYQIPPKFQFRNDVSTTPLKPLNYYLCDGDCLAILKRFYAEDNDKDDIMEDEDIMESYFGTVQLGRQMLEPINEESWKSID